MKAIYKSGGYTYYDQNDKRGNMFINDTIQSHKKYMFDESRFDTLMGERKYNEAADYLSHFHFDDPEKQKNLNERIWSIRREGNIINSIYNNVTSEDDRKKLDFATSLFSPALDNLKDNEYADAYRNAKKMLLGENSTKIRVGFRPEAQPWYAEDNNFSREVFINNTGYTKQQLLEAGVDVYEKDGWEYVEFDKTNSMSDTLINVLPWGNDTVSDDILYRPYIAGLDKDGNVVEEDGGEGAFGVQRIMHSVGSVLNFVSAGSVLNFVLGNPNLDDELAVATGTDNSKGYRTLRYMHELVNDAKDTQEKYTEKKFGEDGKTYSSRITGPLSPDIERIQAMAANGMITESQAFNMINTLGSKNHIATLKSIGVEYEFYTNANQDQEIQTLEAVDSGEREQLRSFINNCKDTDIKLQGMISHGKTGTLVTLPVLDKAELTKKELPTKWAGRSIQIFIPGFLTEEVEKQIANDTTLKAAKELDDIQDYEYPYQLADGKTLTFVGNNQFKYNNEIIDYDSALRVINNDMFIHDATSQLTYQFTNADGNITSRDRYEDTAKKMAIAQVNELFPNIPFTDNNGVEYSDPNKLIEDIFLHKINKADVNYETWKKIEEVLKLYYQLMKPLNYYDK